MKFIRSLWFIWLLLASGVAIWLYMNISGDDKSMYLMGDMTHGHYQIEMDCSACHTKPFAGKEAIQAACVDCHGSELKKAKDAHPKSKFTDPRNADRVAILDARYCVTCHTEHQPERNRAMGVTLPDDYCVFCHRKIAEDRPSHKDLSFDSCASAGCHNFHDNRALYEDFLVKHAGEPETMIEAVVPKRNYSILYQQQQGAARKSLMLSDADYPVNMQVDSQVLEQWSNTGHARSGINCTDCHQREAGQEWIAKPQFSVCKNCHDQEVKGFLSGKHGMRIAQGLSPMMPEMARAKMHKDAAHTELNCNTCHSDHAYDTRKAAVASCLECHDDDHSKAYKSSRHFALWDSELRGGIRPGSGVSCASCHMPREPGSEDEGRIVVQHNQNDNLRPNEKMLRSVCMQCHGLSFALDSLADAELIRKNFSGIPARHIPGIDWAMQRVREKEVQEENR